MSNLIYKVSLLLQPPPTHTHHFTVIQMAWIFCFLHIFSVTPVYLYNSNFIFRETFRKYNSASMNTLCCILVNSVHLGLGNSPDSNEWIFGLFGSSVCSLMGWILSAKFIFPAEISLNSDAFGKKKHILHKRQRSLVTWNSISRIYCITSSS